MQQKIRAFVCIDFPDEVVAEIERIQSLVAQKKFIGKLTEPKNLHLTMKFIGEITPENLEKIKLALQEIKFKNFQAVLQYAGTFSHRNSPKIIWIKVGNKKILELQKQIDVALENFSPKEERFMSHVTIARIKYVADKPTLKEHIKKLKIRHIKFSVESFKLKSSELKPLGPIYTTIEEYKLAQ